jgi:L-cysteine S-thiosulfotransferase
MKTQGKWVGIIAIDSILVMLFACMGLISCKQESRGFVLPDGNIEKGKELFSSLKCTDCHSIADIAWTGSKMEGDPEVKLGGQVTSMKMYGELVTSVINPSHKISQKYLHEQQLTMPEGSSKMESKRYNEFMSVQDLVDLVAYLQSEYKLAVPLAPYPYYPYY